MEAARCVVRPSLHALTVGPASAGSDESLPTEGVYMRDTLVTVLVVIALALVILYLVGVNVRVG